MTASALSSRGSFRQRLGMIAGASLVIPLAFIAVTTPQVSAATVASVTTNFEIDGDDAGVWDWEGVLGNNATTYGPYPAGTPTSSGIIAETHALDACTGGTVTTPDTRFKPGTQLNDLLWPIVDGGPDKNDDLCRAAVAYEVVNVSGQYHTILYMGWDRAYEATGQAQLYLMLNDATGRKHLVNYHFDPSSGLIEVLLYTWDGSAWQPGATLVYEAAFGKTSLVPAGATANNGTFGELAVDLTESGLLPEASCDSLTTGWALSRNGNANSEAGLADVVQPAPLTLNTCQQLLVTKQTVGAVPSTTTFDYSVTQVDSHSIGHTTGTNPLTVTSSTGATVTPTYTTGAANDATGVMQIDAAIHAGETQTYTNVVAEPDYVIEELTANLPTGVRLWDLSCRTYDPIVGAPVTFDLVVDGVAQEGAFFPIAAATIPGAIPAHCTLVNQATSLTLNKSVINDSGGTAKGTEFTLTATLGATVALTGTDPDPTTTTTGLSSLVAAGTYTLSESGGPTGYIASSWTCVVTAADGTVGSPLVGVSSVTIPDFGSANCTITNDDPPSLAWTKIDSHTGAALGGTTWKLVGPSTDLTVADCVTAPCAGPDMDPDPGEFLVLGLLQGDYSMTEVGAPAGYRINTTTYVVSIESNRATTFTPGIANVPTSVSWTKVGPDGNPLGGTSWSIVPAEGASITVDDCVAAPCAGRDMDPLAGAFLVYYLSAGSYTLVETAVPAGYYLDPTEHPFTVDPSVQGTIQVTEGAITNKLVVATWQKVDEFDHELLLAGSSWELYGPDGQFIIVTDCVAASAEECAGPDVDPAAGAFAVLGLAPGDWTLIERDPPVGYLIIADPITLTISSGQEVFDFGAIENYQNGRMTWVKKDDAGAILGGATFEICENIAEGYCFTVEDYTGQPGYEGWDEDERPGYFHVADLIFGDYTLTEISAPDGYLIDETVHEVTVAASADPADAGVFVNIKKVYGLTLTKAAYEAAGEGLALTDGTVDFGDTVSYLLEVTATGNAPQANVTVTDTLPVGVTYVDGSATCLEEVASCTATYDAATRTVTMVVAEMLPGTSVFLVFDVNVDAAPEVAPGTTYSWQGDNVGAAMSTETTTRVTSNIVTVKASKTVLPATGSESGPLVLFGLLAILLGGVLVVLTRRREKHTTR